MEQAIRILSRCGVKLSMNVAELHVAGWNLWNALGELKFERTCIFARWIRHSSRFPAR